jgi:hypothetical protein
MESFDHLLEHSGTTCRSANGRVDHARRRVAATRGSGAVQEPLDASAPAIAAHQYEDIEATFHRLDQALENLSNSFPRASLQGRATSSTTYVLSWLDNGCTVPSSVRTPQD